MVNRRSFIGKTTAAIAGLSFVEFASAKNVLSQEKELPVVISTWKYGMPANEAAWEILSKNGWSLDAVEAGVRVPEADPEITSVGYGGTPDANGKVTLDACIMDEKGRAGSVASLKCIKHPVSVARKILEKTPNVMLVGKGALKFAVENGFEKENLLTREQKRNWKQWKKEFSPKEIDSIENHDTIGMLALDSDGRISGACSTSGLAYKLSGRVGDSPIIGAGLYIDGEIGGAVATGVGELVMKTLGSFLIVEMMRDGMTPKKACEEAIRRITKKNPDYETHQVGFLALNVAGEYGSYSIQPNFNYAIKNKSKTALEEAEAWLKKL